MSGGRLVGSLCRSRSICLRFRTRGTCGQLDPSQIPSTVRQSDRAVQQFADQNLFPGQREFLMLLVPLKKPIAPGHSPVVLHHPLLLVRQHVFQLHASRN